MDVLPFIVYLFLVLLLVGAMLGISYILGQRRSGYAEECPFESGVVSEGASRIRTSVQFYLQAMFFVIFDMETVFIFSWAVTGRRLGWVGYGEILIFIAILLAALAYLWRIGALNSAYGFGEFPRGD